MEEFYPNQITENNISHAAIAYNLFQLENDSSFYLIDVDNHLDFNNIITLLKDSDIFTEDDGIFTWIIGTQLNNNLTSNGPPISCNPSELHLWCKKVKSIQEIRTKHLDILTSSLSNKNIILSNEADKDDIKDALNEGVIDYLLYAGELIKQTIIENGIEKCILTINFLSGTFMNGVVNSINPSQYTKECITNLFVNIVKEEELNLNLDIHFDTSSQTFINQKMTLPLLNEFIYRGAKVYKFLNKSDAMTFKNKALNLARLQASLAMYERMNNSDLIQQTLNKINEINSINIEDYRFILNPVKYGGRRTRKNNKLRKISKSIRNGKRKKTIRKNKKNKKKRGKNVKR